MRSRIQKQRTQQSIVGGGIMEDGLKFVHKSGRRYLKSEPATLWERDIFYFYSLLNFALRLDK